MSREQEYVLRTVEERGVRLIRLWFTDVLGQLKSVAISPAELETVFEEGVQFDGTAIDGFSRVHESDVLARPDATTFELLPWAKADEPSGRMFCDIENLDGTPFEGDPRQILQRNLSTGPATRATPSSPPRKPSSSTSSRATTPTVIPKPIDQRLVLRSHHRRRLERPAQVDHPHPRGDGDPGRVLVPRGQPEPARDRPPLHRGARRWPTTS